VTLGQSAGARLEYICGRGECEPSGTDRTGAGPVRVAPVAEPAQSLRSACEAIRAV